MEIKRILNLNGEEFDKLIAAGELIRSLATSKDSYDELSDGVKKILEALKDVINEVLEK